MGTIIMGDRQLRSRLAGAGGSGPCRIVCVAHLGGGGGTRVNGIHLPMGQWRVQ